MKICFIDQPSGLGDILLTIKIAQSYYNNGYHVIWPVLTTYNYLNKYLKLDCEIDFVDINKNFFSKDIFLELSNKNFSEIIEKNNILYIPLKNSSRSAKANSLECFGEDYRNMLGKYRMCDLDDNNWQECFDIKRNYSEEDNLYNFLQINNNFHLINKEFGTPPFWREVLKKDISTPNGMQKIYMTTIEGYNIFSWLTVFERASIIDTVSTSNFYLFEKINLKCVPTIYSRNHPERTYEENFNWMKKLSKKSYNFVS